MKRIYPLILVLFCCFNQLKSQVVTASDCNVAVNVCDNLGFQVDPNGSGAVNEVPTSNSVSNPSINPGSANSGCLLSGELNSTWLIVNVATTGTLQFGFGINGAQAGFYDWAMWPYTPTTCTNIANNTLAPVRCNWNASSTGGTGLAAAGALPAGGVAGNYEPPLNVTCGQKYIICFSNYSSVTSSVPFDFFGTAQVSCTSAPFTVSPAQTICNGASTTLTASPATGFTYTWNPGGLTGSSVTVSPTTTTTYTVTGTSCGTSTATVTVTVNGASPNFTITNGNAGGGADPTPTNQCVQNDLFNFTSASVGTGITHSWNFGGGGASPATSTLASPTGISYTTPGTYTITHTVTQGACVVTSTQTITVTGPPTVTTAPVNATCAVATGTITATATGGTPGYTYSWAASGGTAATTTALSPGTYTVTVTDANGCSGTATGTIITTGSVTSTFTQSANQCLTGNTFNFTNSGSSGAGINHSWTFTGGTPSTSTAVSPTGITWAAAGTYNITHTVTQGSCTSTTTSTITIFPMPTAVVATPVAATCGNNNGSVTLGAVTGGTPAYTYSFDASAFSNTTTYPSLASGVHNIIVRDNNGCQFTTTVNVGTSAGPTAVVLTPSPATCGLNNGSFTIGAVTGGTSPYQYSVDAGAFSSSTSYTSLASGVHTVIVRDAFGCTFTTTVTVGTAAGPTAVVLTPTNAGCAGNTGTVTIGAVTGGGGTNTFSFDGGAFSTTTLYSGLAAGTHTVIVQDINGCQFTATTTVGLTTGPTALASTVVNASCGNSNGSITLGAVTGGTVPYTYSFNAGAFGPTTTFTSLAANTYTIVVNDNNGCTFTINPVVANGSAPTVAVTTNTPVSCFGGNNGSLVVTGFGGTAPYQYSINGGTSYQLTNTFGTLTAGTYTITIKDNTNCTNTVTATITQPTQVVGSIASQTPALCFGGSTGSVTITGSGGTPALQYNINGGAFQSGNNFGGLAAGTYTVIVKDANNCQVTVPVTITQPTALTLNTTVNNAVCTASNGNAIVTATGATPTYTYLWAPSGGTNATSSNLPAGTYTVTVNDLNNCTATATAVIGQNAGGTAVISNVTNVSCSGQSNGSITVSMTGNSTPGFNYVWTPALTNSATVSSLAAGNYTVTVTDANGCISSANATVTQPTALTLNLTSTNVSCFGGSNGTITANAAGGTPIYSYLWTPGGNVTSSVSGLPIGTYTCVVTDSKGCTATQNVTLVQPTQLTISPVVTQAHCNQSDGGITVTGGGGFAPYTFSINNGTFSTATSFPNLAPNTYTITIKDANACTSNIPVNVSNIAAPVATITSQTNITCNGLCNGAATVAVTGGTGIINYLWSNGSATTTATNLCPGIISVTATDATGCTTTTSTTITQPSLLTTNIAGVSPKCNNGCNGTASIGALGGTPPYTYNWSNSATTTSLTGLCAGPYNVTVTDSKGCTKISNIVLVNPPAISVTTSVTPTNCLGSCDGTATAAVTNGTAPYSYSWSGTNVQTTPTAGNLCAGTYTVNITDVNGCTGTANATITSPTALVMNLVSSTNVTCNGLCNGAGQVSASGANGGYTYNWSVINLNGATQTGLCANTYTVTATDSKGCTATQTVNITQPAVLDITAVGTNITCFGLCNGTGVSTYTGGTGTYQFLWTPSLITSSTASSLCPGVHQVKITDANGCKDSTTITLTEPNQLIASIISTTPSNCLQSNGGACSAVTGGVAPFSYSWSNSQTSSCLTSVPGNPYVLTVTDANGCVSNVVANINDIAAPNLVVNSSTNVTCFGLCDGTANTTITGGAGGNIIQWLPGGQSTEDVTTLCDGNNIIKVTDAAGCVSSQTVVITQPTQLVSAITSSTNINCFGGNTGSATVAINGGTAGYTQAWNDGANQTTLTASSLVAGNYLVAITDANGCKDTSFVTITQPPQLSIQNTTIVNANCFGDSNGSINFSPQGGTPIYSYVWSPNVSTINNASSLAAGNYSVVLTDSKGCIVNQSFTITQPSQLVISAASFTNATCSQNNGTASVTAAGGSPNYSYSWNSPGNPTTASITGLSAGVWTGTVTDSHNCTVDTSLTIVNFASPALDSIVYVAPTCNGSSNATATVYPRGGTNPITVAWNDPAHQITQTASGLSSGTYTVTVTDANGCSFNASITVNQPSPLVMFVSPNDTICYGQTNTVSATGGGGTPPYTFAWGLAGSTFGSTTGGPHTINPTATSFYQVAITDANGCAIPSQQITCFVRPPITPITNDVAACTGQSTTISASATGGNNGPYTYTWNPGGVGQTQTVTAGTVSPIKYPVTISDGCSTPVSDTVVLTINPNPVGVLTANVLSGCEDLTVGFTGVSNIAGSTFDWNYGDSSATETGDTPTHTFYNAGDYDIQVVVTSPLGCSTTVVNTNYIHVFPAPIADFTTNLETTTILDPQINFINQSSGAISYAWNFGDPTVLASENTSTLVNPEHSYLSAGTFLVQLIAVSNQGCKDTTYKPITVDPDFVIYVPNAFSPNGDITNETFFPKAIGIDESKYTLYIFDRWGELIFTSNNFAQGWDGTAKGGTTIVQEDVYVWKIIAYDLKNNKHNLTGHVTVVK